MRAHTTSNGGCVLSILLVAGFAVATIGGCPQADPSTDSGTSDAEIRAEADQILADIDDELPLDDTEVAYTVAASNGGPAGSLFGIGLDNLTVAWVLGELEDDAVNVTGVALETASGVPVLTEEFRADGVKFTLPAGDSIDIETTSDGLKFTLVLEATQPPSVVVAYADGDGNVTIDESASTIYRTPAASYDASVTKARTPRAQSLDAKLGQRAQEATWCEWLGNGLEFGAGQACNIATVLTGKAPEKAIDLVCAGVSNLIIGFERDDDTAETKQTLAALRIGVQALCDVGKSLWGIASFFNNLSPWKLACTVLNYASNASVAFDGRTIADRACDFWGLGSDGVGQGGDPEPNTPVDPNTSGDGDPNEFVYYSLTITIAAGDGSVEVSPLDESFLYQAGDTVTLTPIPARNYEFDHWGGDVPFSFAASLDVTMDQDTTVEVHFIENEEIDTSDQKGTVRSTFDNGDEAWRVVGDAEAGTGVPDWQSAGGNSGGHLTADDDVQGGTWYWEAPVKFYGNFSGAYGQTLTFDLKQDSAMSRQFSGRDVVLTGGGTLIWLDRLDNPGSNWTSYAVNLDTSETWWLDDGSPATEEDIRTVLGALDDLKIRGEYESGSDTGGLDNVVLNAD